MKALKEVIIERARRENLKAIKSLLRTLNLPVEGISDHLHNFFLARYNDIIIGVAGIEIYENIGLMRSVGISKKFQRQGIGKRLVNSVHDYSRVKNIEKIYLFTETAEDMFKKFGYKTIPRNMVDSRLWQSKEFEICKSAPTMLKTI